MAEKQVDLPYTISDEELNMLTNMFTYHPARPDQAPRYEAIREHALHYCLFLFRACPPSRERTLAMRSIQEAVHMANAAIAINEKESPFVE